MSNAHTHEPPPKVGKKNVAEFVLSDIRERVDAGQKKYGTLLQTHNGRDALWDAYQEVIDLAMYIRQVILERDAPSAPAPLPPDVAELVRAAKEVIQACSPSLFYMGVSITISPSDHRVIRDSLDTLRAALAAVDAAAGGEGKE